MSVTVQTENNMSGTVSTEDDECYCTEDNMSVTPQTEYNMKYKLRII